MDLAARPRRRRMVALAVALGTGSAGPDEAPAAVAHVLEERQTASCWWLARAVLTGRLPLAHEAESDLREGRLSNALSVLQRLVPDFDDPYPHWPVRIVRCRVSVDVHLTSRQEFTSGIQRVTRATVRRWVADHDVLLLGWSPDMTRLVPLSTAQTRRAQGMAVDGAPDDDAPNEIVVPWRGTLLVPELPVGEPRSSCLAAFAAHGGGVVGIIGYDLVPVISPETAFEGMPAAFARYLAAVREVDRVAAISGSAAREFRGFQRMVRATGQPGPDIAAIPLPVQFTSPPAVAHERLRTLLGLPQTIPLVLAVGSHEPRKNHLAVLHAAETLWRDGHAFLLVFIGSSSWHSDPFDQQVSRLAALGRPVSTVKALPDDLLAAAYQQARFTVFPSLNEGFGLPVAESLAAGTPVITSNFGSMAEIAAAGGALLVDPRDDTSLTDAMRRLLTNDTLLDTLRHQAATRPPRTWDDYANELWTYLTTGEPPRLAQALSARPM